MFSPAGRLVQFNPMFDETVALEQIARKMIRLKMFVEAYAIIDQLIVGAFTPQGTTIQNLTGQGVYSLC